MSHQGLGHGREGVPRRGNSVSRGPEEAALSLEEVQSDRSKGSVQGGGLRGWHRGGQI